MMFVGIILVCFILFIVYLVVSQPPNGKMPPGPRGLPLIGNLLDLLNQEHIIYYKKLAAIHGPLFSVQFGLQRILVISSSKWVQQAFVKHGDAYTSRPEGVALSYIMRGKGIVMSSEPVTSHARRCLLHSFKIFGFGTNHIENYIDIELQELMSILKKNANRSFNPHHNIATCILNITWQMISGERFETGDPTLSWLISSIEKSFDLVKLGGFTSFISYLQLPVIFLRPKAFQVGWSVFWRFIFFRKSIQKHHQSKDDMAKRENFIYHFLEEQKKQQHKENMHHIYSDDQLSWIMSDLFVASIETTVSSLRWSLLMIATEKNIQKELHNEIDAIVGQDCFPVLSDRKRLPRLEAFIHEILRMFPPIPLVIHATSKDTHLGEFIIPKGTWVLVNLWGIQMDEKVFGDPQNFRPSRFLDEEGSFIRSEDVIPFFLGRRNCIGESLAMAELFLLLATILQRYTVDIPEGENPPNWHHQMKINLSINPPNCNFTFVPRK